MTVTTTFDLAFLDGTNGFILNGIDEGDLSGFSVSSAGDINGDGFADLIIGTPYANPNNKSSAGRSFVVFGRGSGFNRTLELSSLNGSNGFVINGINESDVSGFSVSGGGDINKDGFADLIIGARLATTNNRFASGQSYVILGSKSGFSSNLELATLNGTNGFFLNGVNNDDYSGSSVKNAGDINGDGFDDVIIGAPGADPSSSSDAGRSFVVFGRSGGFSANFNLSSLNGSNGFAINGINPADSSGAVVSGAGDINGDGFGDLIIGAPLANGTGQSYVVFGRRSGFAANLNLSSLNGSNGFIINGVNEFEGLGTAASSAGDINGDGLDDLIIGAPQASPNNKSFAGQSYVIFGRRTGFSNSFDLTTLDGSNGFVINGINAYDFSGNSVSSAGDVNGDGFDDLIIGARYADVGGADSAGQSYLIFGRSGGFSASFNLSSLDNTQGVIFDGIKARDYSGGVVSKAGDLNGDGLDDLIIGASNAGPNGKSSAGQSYVIFGSKNFVIPLPTITLAVNPASVREDDGANLVYTFTRNGSANKPLTVNYTIAGTATNGVDYATIPTSVTFAPGSTTATLTINPTTDTSVENDETVRLTLASGSGYTVGTNAPVTATILNDDLPIISINNRIVVEGLDLNAVLTVSLNSAFNRPVSIAYTTNPVTATANDDYTPVAGTLTIPVNSTTATISIPIRNDDLNENNETFTVNLSNPVNATLGKTSSTVTITDTLQRDVTTTLPNGVENLRLIGSNPINGTGNAGNNRLTGNSANNILNGAGGIDRLIGDLGDDIYIVDTVTDTIIEADNQGIDTIQSSVTYSIASLVNVENLTLTGALEINGTGNINNNLLTGNSANNILNGGAGNDTLVGGLGIDTLSGGLGNDIYIVDTVTDTITEADNQGIDTIQSSVTYSIDSLVNVENLTLTGTLEINGTGNINNNLLTGNSANNILNGGAGDDTLRGNAGNDALRGGAGNDTLTGGAGIDRFEYQSNQAFVANDFGLDTLTDFARNSDKLVLSKTTFTALTSAVGNGFSQPSNFAVVANDTLVETNAAFMVYSRGSGSLFYNQNGNLKGLGTGAKFASFTGNPLLTANDFIIAT